MKKIVLLFVFAFVFCSCQSAKKPTENDFAFSLVWGCYGIRSYDSATGKLVKTSHATHPENYVTTLYLDEEQMREIYALIESIDLDSYPDEYDPHLTEDGQTTMSKPSMDLILTVEKDNVKKQVACRETSLGYTSLVGKGNDFLQVCKKIRDILMETEEWKALPDYEFLYS